MLISMALAVYDKLENGTKVKGGSPSFPEPKGMDLKGHDERKRT